MSQSNLTHRCGPRCITESRVAVPMGIQPEIVVDLDRGKIPLWARNTTLNWRIDEASFERYGDSESMKRKVSLLFRDAGDAWGAAAPVTFQESCKAWDFDISIRKRKDCGDDGCTLASAFFPAPERRRVLLYPSMFEYDRSEQLSTMVHELGLVFGLCHFFADTDAEETKLPLQASVIWRVASAMSLCNWVSPP